MSIPKINVIIDRVINTIKCKITNGTYDVGVTAGGAMKVDVTSISATGITSDVNIHDAAGNSLTSTTGHLDVDVKAMPAITGTVNVGTVTTLPAITGAVTANAGTNLNTSALALETGGNLAAAAGSAASLDGKVTACNTGAVVVSSGTLTGITNAVAVTTVKPDGTNTQPSGDAVARKIYVQGVEVAPDDASQYNPSVDLTWVGDELTVIEKTVGATTKTRTITWTSGKIANISVWT